MTMLPAATTHNDLSKQDQRRQQQQQSYGGLFGSSGGSVMSRLEVEEGYCYSIINQDIRRASELLFGSPDNMGEDNDRSRSNNKSGSVGGCGSIGNNHHHHQLNNNNQQEEEEEEDQEKDEGWLQLSIGRRQREFGSSSSLVELNLLPHSNSEPPRQPGGSVAPPLLNFSSSYPPPQLSNLLFQQPHTTAPPSLSNWAFPPTTYTTPSSSSNFPLSSHHPLAASYFPRPFHFPPADSAAGPSSDARVVDPPRRPHSGIWFMLQASPNQTKEPFLPQIPKSYLRIKDGRMTVRLLLKYLVNKLRLQSESEIEIRCRGQQLGPLLTLEEVRDNIWSSMTPALLSDSSTTDHIMVLYYEIGSPCNTVVFPGERCENAQDCISLLSVQECYPLY